MPEKEYIEREVALKYLYNSLSFSENELDMGDFRRGCIAATQDDIGNIANLPTADVAEVKHGEWKIKTDEYDCEYMMCSCCKSEFYPVDEDTVDTTPNYCPYCGAKMDGAKND